MLYFFEEKKKVLVCVCCIRGQCDVLDCVLEVGVDCGLVLQQIVVICGVVNGLMFEVMEVYLCEEFGQFVVFDE